MPTPSARSTASCSATCGRPRRWSWWRDCSTPPGRWRSKPRRWCPPEREGSRASLAPAMASSPRVLRALDPSEKYFWLIWRLNGMVGVFLADADRTFEEQELADALAAVQTRHPFLRARVEVVDDDYAFVEVD